MKINIKFFNNDFINAIGAGIYEIIVSIRGKSKSLYIGESVHVIVRCSEHLYQLKSEPKYFGFTRETIDRSDITLTFKLIESIDDKKERKLKEKKLITANKPLSQSGVSDRQKEIGEKIQALDSFLNSK